MFDLREAYNGIPPRRAREREGTPRLVAELLEAELRAQRGAAVRAEKVGDAAVALVGAAAHVSSPPLGRRVNGWVGEEEAIRGVPHAL